MKILKIAVGKIFLALLGMDLASSIPYFNT